MTDLPPPQPEPSRGWPWWKVMSAAIVGGLIVVLLLAGACLAFLNELDDSLHGIVLLALGA